MDVTLLQGDGTPGNPPRYEAEIEGGKVVISPFAIKEEDALLVIANGWFFPYPFKGLPHVTFIYNFIAKFVDGRWEMCPEHIVPSFDANTCSHREPYVRTPCETCKEEGKRTTEIVRGIFSDVFEKIGELPESSNSSLAIRLKKIRQTTVIENMKKSVQEAEAKLDDIRRELGRQEETLRILDEAQ